MNYCKSENICIFKKFLIYLFIYAYFFMHLYIFFESIFIFFYTERNPIRFDEYNTWHNVKLGKRGEKREREKENRVVNLLASLAPSFRWAFFACEKIWGQTVSYYSSRYCRTIIKLVEANNGRKKEEEIRSADCLLLLRDQRFEFFLLLKYPFQSP